MFLSSLNTLYLVCVEKKRSSERPFPLLSGFSKNISIEIRSGVAAALINALGAYRQAFDDTKDWFGFFQHFAYSSHFPSRLNPPESEGNPGVIGFKMNNFFPNYALVYLRLL